MEQVIEAIQKASTYYFPLATADYDYLIQMGEIDGPSSQRIYQNFGGWSALCEKAGVESYAGKRGLYDQQWSDSELIDYVLRFLQDPETTFGIDSYETWSTLQSDRVPSGSTLRNRLGSWIEIRQRSLEVLRRQKGKAIRN